jgi:hypothetical protein
MVADVGQIGEYKCFFHMFRDYSCFFLVSLKCYNDEKKMKKQDSLGGRCMISIKKSWLYRQLIHIFGEKSIAIQTIEPDSLANDYTFFPVKNGIDIVGWIGVDQSVLREDSYQLIHLLAQHQSQVYYREDHLEETDWRFFLEKDPADWKERWQQLGYPEACWFGNVYLYIDDPLEEDGSELHHTLKEMIESTLEEESFFLPLYYKKYSWIIPNFDKVKPELDELLKGLVDTITAECMLKPKFYIGQPYQMPTHLKEKVTEELHLFELAITYGGIRSIIHFSDVSHFILLNQCTQQELHKLVASLLGPVLEDKELLHSVNIFLKENLNVSETAKKLFVHRNSMQYRLDKFIEKTGLDIRHFEEAVKVYLAIQALGMMNKE